MMSSVEFYFLIDVFDHLRVDTDQVSLIIELPDIKIKPLSTGHGQPAIGINLSYQGPYEASDLWTKIKYAYSKLSHAVLHYTLLHERKLKIWPQF